jgi:sulfatase maturation enzyme AslB (radical SAM superfamily)
LGGEPSYNEFVLKFLNLLDDKKLSHRTKLEITTNATASTKFNKVIANTNWQHISVMISIDAIGEKAEWLRYGCKWDQVDNNINFYTKTANYVELHFTLHMLNIDDLLEVYDYSQSKNIPMIINYLQTPNFLSLKHWDGPELNLIKKNYKSRGLVEYLHTIGSDPIQGSFEQLKNYIKKFSDTRKSPANINKNLAIVFE